MHIFKSLFYIMKVLTICLVQSSARQPPPSCMARTTPPGTRTASPWRRSSSTPASRATSSWGLPTPSVSSTMRLLSGLVQTSLANVRKYHHDHDHHHYHCDRNYHSKCSLMLNEGFFLFICLILTGITLHSHSSNQMRRT